MSSEILFYKYLRSVLEDKSKIIVREAVFEKSVIFYYAPRGVSSALMYKIDMAEMIQEKI